jgi:hypothetical protein
MPLPDAAFDFVLDKGTLDAVLCSGDVRDENAARMLDEVFRILVRSLTIIDVCIEDWAFIARACVIICVIVYTISRPQRPGGRYLMITTAVPAIRFPHLARVRGWRVYQRLLVDSIRLYVAVKDAI